MRSPGVSDPSGRMKAEFPKGACHEVEERREQEKASIHRLRQVIEKSRHREIAHACAKVGRECQSAVKEEEEGTRQYREEVIADDKPRLEARRRFCNPFHHFSVAHMLVLPLHANQIGPW